MPFNMPRHPIAIIGAGIAGLAAATALRERGVPYFVLERFGKPGGRLNSRGGEGWVADHGTPYIRRQDEALSRLVRAVGLERDLVSVQGGVHRLKVDLTIEVPKNGGVDPDRLCIDDGFGLLTTKLANSLEVRYDVAVGAIRWDNDDKVFWWQKEGKVFWFEDEQGEPLKDPVTQEVIVASGVILATTATAAARIAEKSRSLEGLLGLLKAVKYSRCFTAMFKVPRTQHSFYALQGDRGCPLAWAAFEENKSPRRVSPEYSLLVAHASSAFSDELMTMGDGDALAALYSKVRQAIPVLPEQPISQTYKRWHVAQLESAPLGSPQQQGFENGRWPVNPPYAPIALAGDYLKGARAEHAAESGFEAADLLLAQIPKRRTFLGLELQG